MPKKHPTTTKSSKKSEDILKTVVIFDENLFKSPLCQIIVQKLKDVYLESGNVKIASKKLPIPFSVQWIVPERNSEGERINDNWKTVKHTLVFEPAAKFSDNLKKAHSPQNLIQTVFGPNSETLFTKYKIRLLLHEENLDTGNRNSRTKMTAQERHFIEEVKRMEGARNFETIVGCEMLYGMDFVFLTPSTPEKNECAIQVLRSTKAVLDCLASAQAPSLYKSEDGKITWAPPSAKKIGNTVAVSKNSGHLGLHLIWQKCLMQISKGMGIEQAKVITSHADFASPSATIETFMKTNDEKEGEKILTNIQVRPSASSKDFMSLSARSTVGAEISKKIYHMMTTEDGNLFL